MRLNYIQIISLYQPAHRSFAETPKMNPTDRFLEPEEYFNSIKHSCTEYSELEFNNNFPISEKSFKLLHINMRSLKKNFLELTNFLNLLETDLDAIAITETWFDDHTEIDYFNILNYNFFHKARQKKRGGGVALYVNSKYQSDIIEEKTFTIENVCEAITVEVIINNKKIVLTSIYRAPNTDVDTFSHKLKQLLERDERIWYIMGDFNIDLKNMDSTHTENILNTMHSYSFRPLINIPTRICKQSATIIDNIYTNEISHEISSGTIIHDLSDHLPIFASIKYNKTQTNSQNYKYCRTIGVSAKESFLAELQSTNWDSIKSNNLDSSYNKFIDLFLVMVNKYFPMKKIPNGKNCHKTWMTAGLKRCCIHKNYLYKQFLIKKTEEAEKCYKIYRNKLTNLLKTSKQQHYRHQIEKEKTNAKQMWKILGEITRKNINKSKLPKKIFQNEQEVTNNYDIANTFNSYFSSIGPILASKIQSITEVQKRTLTDSTRIPTSFFIEPTGYEEIYQTINSFQSKTSYDIDGLNMKIVKLASPFITEPLQYICNLSFQTGTFPTRMKMAKIIPVHKGGTLNEVANFRPISLLPQFAKLLEKLFEKRLQKYMDKYNILNENQFGFQSNKNTTHALMDLISEIIKNIDEKKYSIGIFVDLKKAFDTLDHDILLHKIEKMGIRGIALNWIKSFLTNRQQQVSFHNTFSNISDIVCGVPQGSVLGPKLFLLYINDIYKSINKSKAVMFADDTTLISSGKNLKDALNIANEDLNSLDVWLRENKLSINTDKTKFIIFKNSGAKNKCTDMIHIGSKSISMCEKMKVLGLNLDTNLNWKHHITQTANKISRAAFILNKCKQLLPTKEMLTLYNCLVKPHLEYANVLWGNAYNSTLKHLITLQKRIVRIIFKLPHLEHTNNYFIKGKMLKLNDLIYLNTCKEMHKIYYNKINSKMKPKSVDPENLMKQNYQNNFQINPRHPENLKVNYSRTRLRANSFEIKGIRHWNLLNNDIKQIKGIKKFSSKLKKKLITSYEIN